MIQLDFQVATDEVAQADLPTQADCVEWVNAALLEDWGMGETELTLRIVSKAEIQQLNQDYRGKNTPTNVLSFPFENPPGLVDLGEELPYLGDLVICAAVVLEEAKQQQKPLNAHWAHMIVHGCLHLQGMDHLAEDDADEMEALETEILTGLGFKAPYETA